MHAGKIGLFLLLVASPLTSWAGSSEACAEIRRAERALAEASYPLAVHARNSSETARKLGPVSGSGTPEGNYVDGIRRDLKRDAEHAEEVTRAAEQALIALRAALVHLRCDRS